MFDITDAQCNNEVTHVYPFQCSKEADVLKDHDVFIFLDFTLEMKAPLYCKHRVSADPATQCQVPANLNSQNV